jgi:hypothetical protein
MLVVGNSIVSEDIKDIKFCCNISLCKGMCCIEGDYGAPITKQEKKIIKDNLNSILPYLNDVEKKEIKEKNFFDFDNDNELCTRIINGKDCVFVTKNEKGIPICAIQKAYMDKKISFIKPISCHLYPLRIQDYDGFSTVNYQMWDVCKTALLEGEKKDVPLYKFLKEPLIRRFGEKWYKELLEQIENSEEHK